jgi:phosphoenolpyruvate carboxylase
MAARNDELTGSASSALSADIKLLGGLLGKIIREQHGDAAFELVELVRAKAKERRRGDHPDATTDLATVIENLDLDKKYILIKAFTNYFQLINIAEDQQRIRVLRERELSDSIDETIDIAIGRLRDAGLSAADVRQLLNLMSVRLVLTAHPSEAKRREMMVKLQHIAQSLYRADMQATLLRREQQKLAAALAEEIEELWQTRITRRAGTTVADEVEFGLYFLTSTVMDVVTDIYVQLRESLEYFYPGESWDDLPVILRFASWIGGDRDGNPNVTADVTLATLKTQREAARAVYLREVEMLREHLTQSDDEVMIAPELLDSLATDPDLSESYPGEPYRQKMEQIRRRLLADAYHSGEDLYADLLLVRASLKENAGQHVANGMLRDFIRKVRLFGLHLVPLDIREDARLQRAALDEIFGYYKIADNFSELPEADKQAILRREIVNLRPLFPPLPHFSETGNRVITTWRMIAEAHRQYGSVVIDSVIASMSQQPSDVLAMLMLATEVGIQDAVDIVPLFETIDDLVNAPNIMEQLFSIPEYHAHLQKRGMRQQIMLGYSDSSKDGGYIASNWNLYSAQHVLAELCDKHGVLLELFHGRGGSIGRGGGPTNRAILSAPPGSMRGRIKITEQGEVIAYRYSNPAIAQRHLQQVLHAALIAAGQPRQSRSTPEWRAAMDTLAEEGRRAYRSLVYETDGFGDYWQQATPINELARLPISSRPAKRKKSGSFVDVRAIPWVFSWMQSRAIIPSWYGVGTAFTHFYEGKPDHLALLRTMYAQWPFFKALVENVQLDIAKADMGIAELYASLVPDERLRGAIFSRVRAEHELAVRAICDILEQREVLANMPVMQLSIERRNPYIDPINFIQVALLRELRALPPESTEYNDVLAAVLATINGIAAGMKTTG